MSILVKKSCFQLGHMALEVIFSFSLIIQVSNHSFPFLRVCFKPFISSSVCLPSVCHQPHTDSGTVFSAALIHILLSFHLKPYTCFGKTEDLHLTYLWLVCWYKLSIIPSSGNDSNKRNFCGVSYNFHHSAGLDSLPQMPGPINSVIPLLRQAETQPWKLNLILNIRIQLSLDDSSFCKCHLPQQLKIELRPDTVKFPLSRQCTPLSGFSYLLFSTIFLICCQGRVVP